MVPRPPRRRNTPCSLSERRSNISTRCDFRLGYTGRQENQLWSGANQAPGHNPLSAIKAHRSATRQAKPHPLSYQETALTSLPPITIVDSDSKMLLRELPLTSDE